jgi:hypothetical protein
MMKMRRGKEVWSSEYFGSRLYVGTAPYGLDYIVVREIFEETCAWFDEHEANNWGATVEQKEPA